MALELDTSKPKPYPILTGTDAIGSPGLWIDRAAVERNIQQMIHDIGGPDFTHRLRPHVKTHKTIEIIELQVDAGIHKCKVATPREAEVAAEGGATDILIAHQLVGPKLQHIASLIDRYPTTCFSSIVDDIDALIDIANQLGNPQRPFPLRIDVDCGMHRSGIEFGEQLDHLRKAIESNPRVVFAGLHVYDGHIKDADLDLRASQAKEVIKSVRNYLFNHQTPSIVGGGSPSYQIWAEHTDWECSPGTTLFWDRGYAEKYLDMRYEVAAGLLTRVISKPGTNRLCLDLGHKSIAAEMPIENRVYFPEIPQAKASLQSEEHLVITVDDADVYRIGQALTAIPHHICPSVALHATATVLMNSKPIGDFWEIAGRDR